MQMQQILGHFSLQWIIIIHVIIYIFPLSEGEGMKEEDLKLWQSSSFESIAKRKLGDWSFSSELMVKASFTTVMPSSFLMGHVNLWVEMKREIYYIYKVPL